jgi:hypothetical protein
LVRLTFMALVLTASVALSLAAIVPEQQVSQVPVVRLPPMAG